MRILEILFIALLSIQLLVLMTGVLKETLIRKWFWIIPLIVLILHLFIEGYRWQMFPGYFLSLLLLLSLFSKKEPGKLVRTLRNTCLILLLILTVALPAVLPVLSFSNDSDAYGVGVNEMQVFDKSREEILTKNPDDFREVSVRLFYPSTEKNTGYTNYTPNFEKVKKAYEKKLGWPPFLLEYLKYFKIEAGENAELVTSEKFPLVIYSHGLTNNYTEATGRMAKLAGRGYVVVAINHTYSSDYAILSNGEMVVYKALSQLGDPIEKIDSVKTILADQWVDDAKSVIKKLRQSKYSESIDFNSIGLVGFSAGGTMATLGSHTMDNVKAAINLDGTPRGLNSELKPLSPQLFMFSEPIYYSDAQINAWGITREMIDAPLRLIDDRSKKILSEAPEKSYIVRIPGTLHSNFIEYPLISPLSSILEIGGSIDSWKCYRMINEMIYAFLDEKLKNKPTEFPKFQDVSITEN